MPDLTIQNWSLFYRHYPVPPGPRTTPDTPGQSLFIDIWENKV